MAIAIIGIYIAVEKMNITPIATIQDNLQLATPNNTSSSFSCTSELYVDSSRETWVKNYNGDFFRLKNPDDNGTQWYCIEAGGHITGIYNRLYPEVYATWNLATEDHYTCGHGPQCPGSGTAIEYTCPYFVCVGEHYTQDSSYTNYNRVDPKTGSSPWRQSNLYNVAYIVSYQNSDDLMYEIDQETYEKTCEIMETLPPDDPDGWSGAKQHAIWKSIISHNKKSDNELKSYHKEFVKQGGKLYDEATAFRKYYSYIKNVAYPDDGSVDQYPAYIGDKEPGFGLKDQTNNDGVYTFVDQEPQGAEGKVKYTIGPFKINYVNGTMAIMWSYLGGSENPYEIGFSGMTEAYLLDDKGNRIEINRFIVTKDADGKNYSPHLQLKPQYFSTKNEDGSFNDNLVDRYACKYKKTSGEHVVFNEKTGEGQGYPFPREEFYIEFYATEEMSTKVKVHMDFKWLDTSMQICMKEGRKYYSYYAELNGGGNCSYILYWACSEYACWPVFCNTWYHTHMIRVDRSHYIDQQDNMEVVTGKRFQHDESIELDNGGKYFDLTMQIGGFVWEDMNEYSKQGASVDGEYKQGDDNPYQGIEVILHDYSKNNNENVRRTVTDENGYYMFKDVDSRKKYYVEFVFDGQKYENTVYDNNIYTSMLGYKSNATETTNMNNIAQNTNDKITLNARDQYNARFEEIGSYPENYQVRNQLKTYIEGKLYQIGEYNKSYNWTEMKQVGGKWERVESDVAKIYDAVRKQASENAKLMEKDNRTPRIVDPYTEAYKTIASRMRSGSVEGLRGKQYTAEETASILQFLEDRRLSAYTGENGLSNRSNRYYVVKEYSGKFIIATRNEVDDTGTKNNLAKTGIHRGNGKIQIGFTVYTPIYDGAYRDYSVTNYREYIDARRKPSSRAKDNEIIIPSQLRIDYGITRRLYSDAALAQDLYKVTTKINGKTQVYDYDVREVGEDEFHIEQRVDGRTYYNVKYAQGLYKSDWLYSANMYGQNDLNTSTSQELWNTIESMKSTTELEVYATYRVTISNQGNTNMDIQEIVDYFDSEYIFEPNLSFTVYNDPTIDKDNFYDAIHNSTLVNRGGTTALTTYENGRNIESYMSNSQERTATKNLLKSVNANYRLGETIEYNPNNTQIDKYGVTPNGYDSVYITTPQGTQLKSGERLYAYLTFRVKRAGEGARVILDEAEGTAKHNVTEINGYKTYYNEGTRLARYNGRNNYTTRANEIAGIIDTDSTPGNVTAKEPAGTKHDIADETAYEDDTDHASDFTVTLYTDPRKMNGYVWEDGRDTTTANAIVGNGRREDEEVLVDGVTVQLVELINAGNGNYYEFIWKEVSSGADMSEAVIPGADNQGSAPEKGRYEFNNFITGNYIIRFKYGDTYKTALTNETTEVNSTLQQQGLNAKSYNGQDYKSTTYQSGITQARDREDSATEGTGVSQGNATTADPVAVYGEAYANNLYGYTDYEKQNTTGSYVYDIGASDNKENLSDAKDIYTGYTQHYDNAENGRQNYMTGTNGTSTETGGRISALNRQDVIDYSDNDVTNHKAEVLVSPYELPSYNGTTYNKEQMEALVDELMAYTQMRAETGIIDVEYEYNRRVSEGNVGGQDPSSSIIDGELHFGAGGIQVKKDDANKNYIGGNKKNGTYVLSNIDFGLQQRPQAQLELDKRVNNVKVTLANGNVLFDASQKATNVLWLKKGEHTVDKGEFINGEDREIITKGNVHLNNNQGKIQLTMDEEIMHGANIQITYKLEVENTGEYDYNNMKYYYTGTIDKNAISGSIVTTEVDELVDYINNNLEYRQVDNAYIDDENTNTATPRTPKSNKWEVIQKDTLITNGSNYRTNANLINVNLKEQVNEYNTTVHIADAPFLDALRPMRTARAPQSTRTIQLLLTQTLDPESDTDEMTYANIAEIAKTSNTVGRRMAVSVVGNQNPKEKIQEVDADISEDVVILPPFGDDQSKLAIWSIIGVAIVTLLGTGIILIKKFVLKK